MPKDKQFIRVWRQYRGLTQEQLAKAMGIARSYVSHVESGKRRYDQLFLEAAAEALKCRPADLILHAPDDADRARDVIDTLSPESRKRALAIVKALSDSEAR